MRIILTLFVAFCFNGLNAQFSDNFTDGDFTTNPSWSGDNSAFIINGSNQLQLNNTIADASYLSSTNTMSSLDDFEWTFFIRQAFAPSSGNYGRVYLVSDQANLEGSLNGYYLQFGEAGSIDAIELFKQVGTTSTSICRGTDGEIAASFSAGIKVTRNNAGDWSVYADLTGGTAYSLQATGAENSITTSNFIGIATVYTVSNATDFYFDDFNVTAIVPDTDGPTISSATVISQTEVDVLFNEPVDQTTAETTSNYLANNALGTPSSAVLDGTNSSLVHLTFTSNFINGTTNTLTITNVQDIIGNTMTSEDVDFTYFVLDVPTNRSVVINELFADPTPIIGLPDAEYIELFNATTDKYFDLQDWTLSDGSSTATLPSYSLFPGQYVIICSSTDETLFSAFSNVIGVSSFPTLNNGGDNITLEDNSTFVVDNVNYTDAWYHDSGKAGGGYSLELKNPFLPCQSESNWDASNDASGGTPGSQNSIYSEVADTEAPNIILVETIDELNVIVHLSEPIEISGVTLTDFIVSGGITVTAFSFDIENKNIDLVLSPALIMGETYTLTILNLIDCSGNTTSNSIDFVLPFEAEGGDIIINEILFDPFTGGDDFVELYNNSDRAINLKGLHIANEVNDVIDNEEPIFDYFVLNPKEFVVITEDTTNIKDNYPFSTIPGRFIESDLPSYSNDKGVVHVLLKDSTSIDRFAYDSDMHFKLIKSVDGKSLERIDYNRPTNDETNWHTAAENVGFATPGRENSQQATSVSNGDVTIHPEIFSPDNDGYEDVITFSYIFELSGLIGNAYIYDSEGRLIKYLIQNEVLGTSGSFSWDGIDEKGEKGRIGAYIFVLELYDLNGAIDVHKKTFVLGGKL